ncbi:MAG TPA: M28 family peptidase [Myxococcaceae bacterium]
MTARREPLSSQRSTPAADVTTGRAGNAARGAKPAGDQFERTLSTPAARPPVALDGAPRRAAGTPISQSVAPQAPIPDNQSITSSLSIAEDVTVDALKLDLDIAHTYRGDLVVTLTSPSGKSAVISNKEGGGADNLKGSFDLSAFAGEKAQGTWKLEVKDTARQDTGTLEKWGLTVTPRGEQPTPQPSDDSDPMKHIAYLSSDELKGRDSPSPELSAASVHVADFAKKYGLVGPNSNNPAAPYHQSFKVFSFANEAREAAAGHEPGHAHEPHKDFGHQMFDEGFYLDDKMPLETREVLTRKYEQTQKALGHTLAPRSGGPMSVDELRQVSQFDGMTQNTLAMLPGTGPHKDEVIVVMAHLDHIGTGRGGVVMNGADDNASGSAVLMASIPELVEAQKAGKLDRSILFLWTGAEEKGLVGSQYFVDNPIPGVGLDKISGVINMDMVGRWDDQRLSVVDTNSRGQANYFRDLLGKANQELADPFDRLNQDINQYRDRQDGAVFSRKGEDVLFMFEGLSNPNGGGSLNPDYHQPGDDIDKIIRDNGGNKPRRVKDLMVNLIELASNRPVS